MNLGKVKDIITSRHYGKICRTHSDEFGDHEYLIAKFPKDAFALQCIFIRLEEIMDNLPIEDAQQRALRMIEDVKQRNSKIRCQRYRRRMFAVAHC